jgi:hypothetical protein
VSSDGRFPDVIDPGSGRSSLPERQTSIFEYNYYNIDEKLMFHVEHGDVADSQPKCSTWNISLSPQSIAGGKVRESRGSPREIG